MTRYRIEGCDGPGWAVYERAWWGWRKIGGRHYLDLVLRDLLPFWRGK